MMDVGSFSWLVSRSLDSYDLVVYYYVVVDLDVLLKPRGTGHRRQGLG